MKKIAVIIFILISCLFIPFIDNPGNRADAKFSIVDLTSTKIYETFIKRELKDELGADFDVKLEIYSAQKMKEGVFKTLNLSSPKVVYRGLSLSDVTAQTKNENNRIVYKNKRVYYPEELPLKFSANITNQDLISAMTSDLFNAQLEDLNVKTGGFFTVETPAVEIKSGKIYFDIPIKIFLSDKPVFLHFNSDIETQDNELMLTNINFTSNSNVIKPDIFNSIASALNPFRISKEKLQNKFCNIIINNAEIKDDIINLNGDLIIKANYRGKNE